jgi:lysophospholipase L1-like esterase
VTPGTLRNRRRWAAGLVAALSMLAVSGCASAGAASPEPTVAPSDRLYVSIGDSYAAGYQPSAAATTTNGFAYQVADRAGLRLVNFGCSGVTSTELLNTAGCDAAALGPGASGYAGTSQSSAAVAFLKRYHAQLALVTIVVGGNDVKPCLLTDNGGVRSDATACAIAAVGKLRANLATLLGDVRSAVGTGVRVVGLTYPDVYLGQWVSSADGRVVAADSVGFFRNVLNPALRDRYTAVGAKFVDVTAVTGGYGPLTDTVEDGTYGTVPVPVAKVCALTFYCSRSDPHPTTDGYTAIANQVLTAAGVA